MLAAEVLTAEVLTAEVLTAEVLTAEVLTAEMLAAEALLNSVHAVNASFADLVGIKNIHVKREKSSTKMIKNRFPPKEIGRGPPMSEWMSSRGLDALFCVVRLICSFCLPARHGGHVGFPPGVQDMAISVARPEARSLTD